MRGETGRTGGYALDRDHTCPPLALTAWLDGETGGLDILVVRDGHRPDLVSVPARPFA